MIIYHYNTPRKKIKINKMIKLKNFCRKIIGAYDFIGMGLVVFLIPLFFSWFFWGTIAFELNKTVLFRILLIASIATLSLKFFIKGQIKINSSKRTLFFAILTMASFFISALLSKTPLVSFFGSYDRQQGFYTLIFYVLFFILLSFIIKNIRQIKSLLIVLVASSTLVCVYGCLQLFGIDFVAWNDLSIIGGRMFSSIGQPNFLGQFIILIIPAILYLLYSNAKTVLSKISLSAILLLHIFCLYSTYSRSAWIAFLFSLFVFAIWRLVVAKKRKTAISLSVALAIFVLSSTLLGVGRLNDRFADSGSLFLQRIVASADIKGGSAQGRLNYWKAASAEIKNMDIVRLSFGFGPDSLYDVFAKNYKPSWSIHERLVPDRAHNILFDTILQFGFFGLAVGIFFIVFLIKKISSFLKKGKENEGYPLVIALSFSLFANLIYNLFSFSLTVHAIVLCLFLAILIFFVDQGEEKTISLKWPLWARISSSALVILISALAIFHYNIKFIIADDYHFKANATNDCTASWEYSSLASQSNETSIYYKDMLMTKIIECMEKAKTKKDMMFVGEKAKYTLDHVEDDKGDFHFLLNKAMIGTILGGERAKNSLETFSLLEKDYESIDLIYQYHAYAQIMKKDYDGAISTMKKGLSALPPLEDFEIDNSHKDAIEFRMFKFYELIGQAYEASGEKEKAIPYYKKILSIYPTYSPAQDKIKNILDSKR